MTSEMQVKMKTGKVYIYAVCCGQSIAGYFEAERVPKVIEFFVSNIESQETIDDGFGSEWSAYCPKCKQKTMQVMRPGQVQCCNCGV